MQSNNSAAFFIDQNNITGIVKEVSFLYKESKMSLPNEPLVRLINYFNDRPFWVKRWDRVVCRCLFVEDEISLHVKSYVGVLNKEEDPCWRLNQPWILLSCDSNRPFYPAYMEAKGMGYYM